MRHGIAGNTLNRKTSHRKATVRDIAKATLIQQRISTTKAKAKESRKLVDKLITLGKKGELAHKRQAFAVLCDHKLVSELFNKIAPRFKERNGGYTRIIPSGNRRGDNAQLVFLELTEKEEIIVSKTNVTAKSGKKEVSSKKISTDAQVCELKKGKESEVKDIAPEKPKAESKKSIKQIDISKEKASKKFVGGIRKMFKRKAPNS